MGEIGISFIFFFSRKGLDSLINKNKDNKVIGKIAEIGNLPNPGL